MTLATIHEAKTHLSKLIQKALNGEEVIIAKRDQPVVRLAPVTSRKSGAKRPLGWAKGPGFYMAEDFNEPLDDFAEYGLTGDEGAEDRAVRRRKK